MCYGQVVAVGGEVLDNGIAVQTAMPSTSVMVETAMPSTSVVVPGKAVQTAMPSTSLTLLLMTFLLIKFYY